MRAFSPTDSSVRLSWNGLAMPGGRTEARVVVYAETSGLPYRAEWTATILPGSASYLAEKWVYDPSAKTLAWVDSYPFTNVVKNVTATGSELKIGNNRGDSPAALNLDFSPGIEGDWRIVEIAAETPFSSASVITNLVCPPTLRRIGRAAFENNKTIRHVTFNEGLGIIGPPTGANNCFNGCTALESISGIPSTVTNAGPSLFNGCSSLTNDIVWPRSVPIVPDKAFNGTSIRSFRAEYGVTHMGSYGSEARVTGMNNAITDVDLPVTLQYVAGRMFSDTSAAGGFTANVWYRGFPKLGWHKTQWANMSRNTVTNWFEWHHRDEFRAFAETNAQFTIRLPETFRGVGTFDSQFVRWWKDPDQEPPSVMILR